jgi:hypothetical protein
LLPGTRHSTISAVQVPEGDAMRGKVWITLALALAVAIPSVATRADETKKDEAKEKDHFVLYRVAGRTWTIRRVPKQGTEGGNFGNSYLHHEVIEARDDRAVVHQSLLDAARKSNDNVTPIKVAFDKDGLLFKDPAGFNKMKQEGIKVQAGTFDCIRWFNNLDGGATVWMSVDFPSLLVKSDDRFGTRELMEFDFIEGDPGYKAPRKKRGSKSADAKIEPKRLFGDKGKRWVHKTTITKGPMKLKSFEVKQYEIAKADDKGCTLEVTPLAVDLQKIKGAETEKIEIEFETQLNDWLEPRRRARLDRTERRLTKFGLFECSVWTFHDDEKRECFAWYVKEWPGLIVRKTVSGEEYEAFTELVEFEE